MEDGVDATADGNPGDHVVLHEGEARVVGQVRDVLRSARDEVVDRDDFPVAGAQRVAEMGAHEAGAAGDDRAGHQRPTPW